MGFKRVHLYSQRTMQKVWGKVLECVLKVLRSGIRINKDKKKKALKYPNDVLKGVVYL